MNSYKKEVLEKLMDLKIDIAFQKVIGGERNVLIPFLNELLERRPSNKIQRIFPASFFQENPLAPISFSAITVKGQKLHILLNFFNCFDIVKRSFMYAAKAYSGQSGHEMHPVIFINLLSYELLPPSENFYSIYLLKEQQTDTPLPDLLELHFIEFPKLLSDFLSRKINPWHDAKARWLLFLAMVDGRYGHVHEEIYKELDLISLKEDAMRLAFNRWHELSRQKEERSAYEERLKQILAEEKEVREAKLREEAAFEKGAKQLQISIAKKMLEEQMEIESIAKITGLTIREIQRLKDKSPLSYRNLDTQKEI